MRFIGLVVSLAVIAVACAADPTVAPTTTSTTTAPTTTAPPQTTSTTVATTTTTTTAEPEVDVEIRDGEVTSPDRFEYGQGEEVNITVLSDTAYELHVHGYDLRFDLEPGVPFTIEFVADVPGIFEVETHPDHLVVFEIEVGG